MLLLSLLQNRSQPIPSQGVVGYGQKVAQPQTAAVAHQNPCRQQDLQRAVERAPRRLRGYRKQMPDLVMGPGADHRQRVLDTADAMCTIVHHKPVSEGGFPQGAEHPSMVVDRGGGEMTKSVSQVRIDVVDGQVAHPPSEPLGQHNELLSVVGASPHAEGVALSELPDGHVLFGKAVDLGEGGQATPSCGLHKSPAILPGHNAPLAQLDRIGRSSPLSGWLSRILEGALLALLVALIFFHAVGTLLTLLALGQFGRALVLFRRGLRRDSVRRTEAASH